MMKNEKFYLRYLNPLTDFGFHKIFGTESSKELLIDFLNQVIGEEGFITEIEYLPPENWGFTERERKAVFDIFCTNAKGEYFIVEMQRAKQPFFRDRSIFYASLPMLKQAIRGKKWKYQLKAVYVVAILDFVLFDEFEEDKNQIVEHVRLIRERTKTLYSKNLNLIFVELPKFSKNLKELITNFDRWLFILRNLPELRNQPIEIQGNIFDKLFEMAEIKQLTKEEMGKYRKSILEYEDVRDAVGLAFEEGEERGIERGIERGRKEEKLSFIKKCLHKNMPIEDIVDLTGFSKEQIIMYSVNSVNE